MRDIEFAKNEPDFGIASSKSRFMHQSPYKLQYGESTLKKLFATIFVLTIIISACSPSIPPIPSENAPIVTTSVTHPIQSSTTTVIPLNPTFTPTSTLSLPVSQLTPVPSSKTKITEMNLKELQEIAYYYGQINYSAKVTKDNKFLFILDPTGITKYDYASLVKLAIIPIANYAYDFQISNDGRWLMVDQSRLIDFRNETNPQIYILSEKINYLYHHYHNLLLSPDGSVIAVEQVDCHGDCKHAFSLISTEDFSELQAGTGLNIQVLGAFSSDGKYFALSDYFTETHPDGSTNPGGGSVRIFATKDFTTISSMNLKFPFEVSSVSFSEDGTMVAVAQRTSIDIYDVASGNTNVNIANLCDSYQRKVLFVPSSLLRLLESSDCSSGTWTISEGIATLSTSEAPDFSKIVFDKKGEFKNIAYPKPLSDFNPNEPDIPFQTNEWFKFNFTNNDSINFKSIYLHIENYPYGAFVTDPNTYSCNLDLAKSSVECQAHLTNKDDIIIATDNKYYGYSVYKDKVDVYALANSTQVLYSIPFKGFHFRLLALDTINETALYQYSNNSFDPQVFFLDLTSGKIIEQWTGQTDVRSIAISGNNKFAVLCRTTPSHNEVINTGRLVILDLVEKTVINNEKFSCFFPAIAMTSDGSYIAAQYLSKSSNGGEASTKLVIINTSSPNERKFFDINTVKALAYSSDDSILAVACEDGYICFLNPLDGTEYYRLKAHTGISKLAFSQDGTVLAALSGWGLISLWAVPPFTSSLRQSQASTVSTYAPISLWNFDEDGNFQGWGEQDWQSAGLKDLLVKDGYFSATTTKPDPELYSDEGLGIEASKLSEIEVSLKVSAGKSAVLYFNNASGDWAEEKGKYFDIFDDNEFHTYIIDMDSVDGWKGTINQLRLDLREASGAMISIDYIRLLP